MNVLIIDDHQIVEDGLRKWFLKINPKTTCYFVDNVKSASTILQKYSIELILCDLDLKNDKKNDGFKFIEGIVSFEPNTKAIAYTGYDSYRIMKKALNSGFLSFLNKGCTFKDFEETITMVLESGKHESETMKELFKKRYEFTRSIFSDSINGVSDLSDKELELTVLTVETTDKNILGKKMGVKPSTIDSYFQKITEKLHLKHRQDVAFFSNEFEEELLKMKSSYS
jgi:DNA-binding NarL/FixJ family response regulator